VVPEVLETLLIMKRWVWLAIFFVVIGQGVGTAMGAETKETVRITVLYNNVPHKPGLSTPWGFAALVESGSDSLLFDTGGDGPTLLANMKQLEIEPKRIDAVFLSHIHRDHTGGLDDFLARRPEVTVYMPQTFPASFRRAAKQRGAQVVTVDGPQRLFANLHSTGVMSEGIDEQSLIIETSKGLIVITGCAHPDIVKIAKAAHGYRNKEIYLLMGGFHLRGRRPDQNRATINALRKLGVRKVAPSHCTGDEAIAMFRAAWGKDFIKGGCGAIIELP
jgi:7,8-dihydropterin-6-yl-methyl-4-(beta-D-ribofuranosyl)aminobenzene 5'-phosphate synthase